VFLFSSRRSLAGGHVLTRACQPGFEPPRVLATPGHIHEFFYTKLDRDPSPADACKDKLHGSLTFGVSSCMNYL
jgi:hypothetical protein